MALRLEFPQPLLRWSRRDWKRVAFPCLARSVQSSSRVEPKLASGQPPGHQSACPDGRWSCDYRRDAGRRRVTTNATPHMKRREFIGIAAFGAAGAVLPTARADVTLASTLAHPRLIEILHDARIVAELGTRYRERVPGEDNADLLTHAILGHTRSDLQAPSLAESATLRAHLDALVRADFAEGRTILLDGWIVSLTEARQCALFSMLPA